MERTGTLYDFIDKDHTESSSSFHRYIEQLIAEKKEPVRALTIISEKPPKEIFRNSDIPDFNVKIEGENSITNGILSRRRVSEAYEDGEAVWEDQFYVISHEEQELYTIFTVSDKDFFEMGISRYIQSLSSEISPSYLSSEELRNLVQYIDRKVDGNLDVKKAVLKTTQSDTQIDYHQDEIEYYEVFNDANRNNRYVDKMEMSLTHSGETFDFFICREGISRFIKGDADLYFNILLPQMSRIIAEKDKLFSNKGREYGSRETHKIEIAYENGSIRGVEENKRLIKALKGISRASVTVYHANPYMHASVLDFDDGTNVDIYLKSDSEISLIPGFNASRKSLNRICDQINKGFLEGEVVEPTEENREFDDYFSPA